MLFSMYVTGMFQYIPPSHSSYSLPQLALLTEVKKAFLSYLQ